VSNRLVRRVLDESYPEPVRRNVTTLTLGRLCANACYRFAAPFLAVIARGLHVSIAELGVAIAVSEICGLTSPLLGHAVDRVGRRGALSIGLIGAGCGAFVAAAAGGRLQFGIGLVLLAQSKVVFDLALGAWVTDHVDYARRGRVVGVTETSWALGLLVGVSVLGIVTAVSSWRWGYATGAIAVVGMGVAVWRRLRDDEPAGAAPPPTHAAVADTAVRARVPRVAVVLAGACMLMAASQCVFVTFGSWLKDTFGFGAAALSAVTFMLGTVELGASVTAARRSDHWGKERSTAAGAVLMVPALLVLWQWHDRVAPGLVLLAVALIGFEFAIVSALPIGATLLPGAPGRSLGMMIATGTAGRAAMSIVATRMYAAHGVSRPMLLGALLATGAAFAFSIGSRVQPR
jgi:predicted MFS family arabinose efflux permease